MDAAEIFAIAMPAAVEADVPASRQRQVDVVSVKMLVAEVDDY